MPGLHSWYRSAKLISTLSICWVSTGSSTAMSSFRSAISSGSPKNVNLRMKLRRTAAENSSLDLDITLAMIRRSNTASTRAR